MAETSECAGIDKPLNIEGNFLAKVTLNAMISLDDFAELDDFIFAQVFHSDGPIDAGLFQNFQRGGPSDSINVGQPDVRPLVSRQIDASNTCHDIPLSPFFSDRDCASSSQSYLALALFVTRIVAQDADDPSSTNDFTFRANRLDG
jgi:hypothetical protein